MFQLLKQLKSPVNKDLRTRMKFTLIALLIFIVGTNVRVPGTQDYAGSLGFLELINVMGGGALKNFSIFALVLCLTLQHQLLCNYYRWILFHTLVS